MKKTRAIIATLCLGFTLSGCIGPNSATNKLRNWNAEVTTNKYANAAIGAVAVPAQIITWLADITVLNTWQFWVGDAIVADPGAFPTASATADEPGKK